MPGTGADLSLPDWIWGGNLQDFLQRARLHSRASGDGATRVQSLEAYQRRVSPGLVDSAVVLTSQATAGPAYRRLAQIVDPELERKLSDVARRHPDFPEEPARGSDFPTLVNYLQMVATVVDESQLAEQTKQVLEAIQRVRYQGDGSLAFPHASVLIVRRDAAILHRLKLAPLMLRLQHDASSLQHRQYQELQKQKGLVFASSEGLARGATLMDAYLAPVLAALSPGVWAFAVHRSHGTLLFSYGRPASGTSAVPSGLLGTLRRGLTGTPGEHTFSEFETDDAPESALGWWVNRLDQMFAVSTDPGTFADAAGVYEPVVALQTQLSIEQVFARTASVLLAHDDPGSRLPAALTVIDTLQSLTGVDQRTLFRSTYATAALRRLADDIPLGAAEILLPAAQRAVKALLKVQDGFFLRDGEGGKVTVAGAAIDLERAAAQYMVELRNATHGFTTTKTAKQQHLRDLLTKHDGNIDSDLGLLAWLYLLDLVNQPDRLRRCVQRHAAAHISGATSAAGRR